MKMSDEKKKRQRNRNQQQYKHRTNAIHVTLYDPHGETVPAEVRNEAADLLMNLAFKHNLLIATATS
jgi:hypothetical protein